MMPVVEAIQLRPGVFEITLKSSRLPPMDQPLTPYGSSFLFEWNMYRPVARQLLLNW